MNNNVLAFTAIDYLESYFGDLTANAKKLVLTEEQQHWLDLLHASPEYVRDNIDEIMESEPEWQPLHLDIDDFVDVYKESVDNATFCEWCLAHELYNQYEDAEFTVYIH